MATSRHYANTQPTYDFLTGSPIPEAGKSQSFRQSQVGKHDAGNQDLRAELNALQYELSSLKQERDLHSFKNDKELRDLRAKAEADDARAQAAENVSHTVKRKYDSLVEEWKRSQDAATNERATLVRELRAAQEQTAALEEEAEEARTELATFERQAAHQLKEMQQIKEKLQDNNDTLHQQLDQTTSALQDVQQRLSRKEVVVGELEGEMLRLKAQAGDADTLNVIKRELSEQVAHIKKLEAINREQLVELKHHRRQLKSVELVEEEKRELESKLRMMDDLRKELSETQLRYQILEDERQAWTVFLKDQQTDDVLFESPEALAKALAQEKLETAALVERMGRIEPELSEKDELIKSLEAENGRLKGEVKKGRASGTQGLGPSWTRLDRQRKLAFKEVEFLRAQLKTFDAEDTTFQPDNLDGEKASRIQQLENLVDQYRSELQTINSELIDRESSAPPPQPSPDEQCGVKRPRDDEPDERLGLLSRKNRKLQHDASQHQQTISLLSQELDGAKTHIASLQASSGTRILELRANPSADAAAIKLSTLTALRSENGALLAQLEGRHGAKVVPISTLDRLRLDMRELEQAVADKDKRITRLKEIWSAKSLEFREAVASVLGWKMDFLPNGRVRVTSMFYPDNDNDDGDGDGGGHRDAANSNNNNSIIFDGENGTMKIAGGPNGPFAKEIRALIRFWVQDRKEIPCFLAAMTLEFYERTTRAAKV
ncbi:MAG: Mitotic spindle assembly checkpoint protein MAD1 [Phylliscum demangeonii]|nr:MAG: Mitotic spindle assembly checkpoint protein MAD1 [Phylliscum demangeonii]